MSLKDLLKKTCIYKAYNKKQLEQIAYETEIRKKYFKDEADLMLRKFTESLNSAGIKFWLDFGTLLGFYREHDFIKHDCDLDFGVMIKDADRVKVALENNGFKRISLFKSSDGGIEECYKFMHTSLDIFYFREEDNRLYCNTFVCLSKFTFKRIFSFNNKIPCSVKKIYIPNNGFSETEYKGCKVGIPNNIREHLELHYGKSFMTPDPNFDYKKVATNIIYYKLSEVSGYLQQFGNKV